MLFPSIVWTAPTCRTRTYPARRGAVLLIVLVILTIFAVLGLAFMFYAESEAVSAGAYRESIAMRGPDIDPELAFSMFLQQLLFDCRDDASGVSSALRGHSLVRNMYGLKSSIAAGSVALDPNNNVPFNGTGRLHWTYGPSGAYPADPLNILKGADDYNLVNYTFFPQDKFVRDPERLGWRASPAAATNPFIGGFDPPYTAADTNFMALAAIGNSPLQSDAGTVLLPSFHRPWTGFGSLDPNNPNWSSANPLLKYMVLRPRPGDNPSINGKPGFSPPDNAGGDARNAPAAWHGSAGSWAQNDGTNDSIWIYTGAPIFNLPDGRQYTYLCAPLIVDLDGKLNISAAGNIRAQNNSNASHQGVGPWEINPGIVGGVAGSGVLTAIDPTTSNPEWLNLFLGTNVPTTATQRVLGKYGALPNSLGNATAPFTATPHSYAKFDYDAVNGIGGPLTAAWTAPGSFQCWPTYPAGYDNADPTKELKHHPLTYNPSTAVGDHRVFMASELNKIYRYGDTNSDAMLCDLWQLLPTNLGSDIRKRNMITTLSFDRREVGMMPWLYNLSTPALNAYQLLGYTLNANSPLVLPQGYNITNASMPTATPGFGSPSVSLFATQGTRNIGREYNVDWRGQPPLANSVRVSLAPNLPNYPAPSAATGQITDFAAFTTAQNARTAYAAALFRILVKATGAYDIFGASSPPAPGQGDRDALRFLAQLAVNIVDFIDTDDYITPFNWGLQGAPAFQSAFGSSTSTTAPTPWSSEWVYGTEAPKVVINEAYCEYLNDTQDPGLKTPNPANRKATYYLVDTWVELCNPFKSDPTLTDGGNASLFMGSGTQGYPIYRLLLTNSNKNMHAPGNCDGRPDNQPPTGPLNLQPPTPANFSQAGAVLGYVDKEFGTNGTTSLLTALNGNFAAPNNQGSNAGFFLMGPKVASSGNAQPLPHVGGGTPLVPGATLSATGLRYKFLFPPNQSSTQPVAPPQTAPVVMLQRLLCPNLPPNPTPSNGFAPYNPYITVDYFDAQPINNAVDHNNIAGSFGDLSGSKKAIKDRQSYGRTGPYVGAAPLAQVGFATNQPKHTFFYHNVNASTPVNIPQFPPQNGNGVGSYPAFDWLVHLDRPLISPMELLNVSGYAPHELTQLFNGQMCSQNSATRQVSGHQAQWFDNALRLYRFFEFVQTPPRQTGAGARIAGKMNINTIWDQELFTALCDPNSSSHFTSADVGNAWGILKTLRNPSGAPGPTDQPFLPFTAGVVPVNDAQYPSVNYPYGVGIGNTLLRPGSAAPSNTNQTGTARLFDPQTPPNNPYQRFEMLSKIYNNVTVRSNCFAVFVTIGFFEVNFVDPNQNNRIYLGQEINRAEGRNIRHRMFAIVDRSVMDGITATSNGMPFMPAASVGGPGGSIVQQVLNGTIPFNPHSPVFKDLVPYFTVIE